MLGRSQDSGNRNQISEQLFPILSRESVSSNDLYRHESHFSMGHGLSGFVDGDLTLSLINHVPVRKPQFSQDWETFARSFPEFRTTEPTTRLNNAALPAFFGLIVGVFWDPYTRFCVPNFFEKKIALVGDL